MDLQKGSYWFGRHGVCMNLSELMLSLLDAYSFF